MEHAPGVIFVDAKTNLESLYIFCAVEHAAHVFHMFYYHYDFVKNGFPQIIVLRAAEHAVVVKHKNTHILKEIKLLFRLWSMPQAHFSRKQNS